MLDNPENLLFKASVTLVYSLALFWSIDQLCRVLLTMNSIVALHKFVGWWWLDALLLFFLQIEPDYVPNHGFKLTTRRLERQIEDRIRADSFRKTIHYEGLPQTQMEKSSLYWNLPSKFTGNKVDSADSHQNLSTQVVEFLMCLLLSFCDKEFYKCITGSQVTPILLDFNSLTYRWKYILAFVITWLHLELPIEIIEPNLWWVVFDWVFMFSDFITLLYCRFL